MKPYGIVAVLFAALAFSNANGQSGGGSGTASTQLLIVKKVHLKLMDAASQISLLSGNLYRVPLAGDQRMVAKVSVSGELDQPYTCTLGDRLFAVPIGAIYVGEKSIKPCGDPLEFEYQKAYTVALEKITGGDPIKFGTYLTAYSDLTTLYWAAAGNAKGPAKEEYITKARATETALYAATAMALGDDTLDKFVTRDPGQGYKLLLSVEGVSVLKKFQRENNLLRTGKLDFATLFAVGKLNTPDALRSPAGDLLVLPTKWINDEVIRGAQNKSAGLTELHERLPLAPR